MPSRPGSSPARPSSGPGPARARAEALGVECKVGLATRPVRVVILSIGLLSQPILVQLLTLNDTLFNQNPDITIPVVTTSIKVDLPKEKNMVRETKPETVIISVDVKGKIFLYDTPIKNSDDLLQRMKKFAVMKPQPEVQIRGDGKSDFESVGRVMYAVQRAGITKVGFITEPQ